MKTLYFEGAGMNMNNEDGKCSDVGNYRIRTAFTNDKGDKIYLELSRGTSWRYNSLNGGKKLLKPKIASRFALVIDSVHYITGGTNDENEHNIKYDWKDTINNYSYTKENIIKWVNTHLNCAFDTMEVLDDMEGYRVFKDHKGYNLMENHVVNPARTIARNEAYNMIDQVYREHCQEKYSVISLMSMGDAE